MQTTTRWCLLSLILLCTLPRAAAQDDRIRYEPEADFIDQRAFMTMMGFDYNKFVFKADGAPYVNVYIDEYLNDTLINAYDHVSANKDSAPRAYYDLVFTRLDTAEFTLRVYSHSQSDTIERIQFRIGELGLYRSLRVNRDAFSYSWKTAEFADNIGPRVVVGEKISLLYYAAAVEKEVDGETVEAFCEIPNILNNRDLIENQGKISHFFEIGLKLVERIE